MARRSGDLKYKVRSRFGCAAISVPNPRSRALTNNQRLVVPLQLPSKMVSPLIPELLFAAPVDLQLISKATL